MGIIFSRGTGGFGVGRNRNPQRPMGTIAPRITKRSGKPNLLAADRLRRDGAHDTGWRTGYDNSFPHFSVFGTPSPRWYLFSLCSQDLSREKISTLVVFVRVRA